MSVVTMANNIKELFPDYIVLFKIGTFYEVYNKDAIIISYLFKYKLKNLTFSDKSCGFPIVSINKVRYLLENKNINYIMLDKSHNYEEEDKINFKKKNKYNEAYDVACEYLDKVNRIEKIKNYLFVHSDKIINVEKVLYER